MDYFLDLVYEEPLTKTSFSDKEIKYLAKSWSDSRDWEELRQILEVPAKNAIAEISHDEDKCTYILQEWIQKKARDRGDLDIRETLADLFQKNEYYSMSSVVHAL